RLESGGVYDDQCPHSRSFYGVMDDLQMSLLPRMESLTGLELFKTYNYLRIYRKGETLKIHTDRPACEISMTLCLGLRGDPWAIHIGHYDDDNNHEVCLLPGDALIYHGCDLPHWRDINTSSDVLTQIFIHYVNKHGPYAVRCFSPPFCLAAPSPMSR